MSEQNPIPPPPETVHDQESYSHLEFADLSAMESFLEHNLLWTQELYLNSEYPDTQLITGVGSGKTTILSLKAMRAALYTDNNYGLIGRDTQTALEATTRKDFFDLLPADRIIEERKGSESYVKLRTINNKTSTIAFRYLNASRPGQKHLSGLNLGFALVDQLEDCDTDSWDYLVGTRIRRKISGRRFHGALSNPKGKDWVYKRYVEPSIKGADGTAMRKHKVKGVYSEYTGTDMYPVNLYYGTGGKFTIQSTSFENIHLPADFFEKILLNQAKEYIDRYLLASFEEWGGKIYKMFKEDGPNVIDPFPIPDHWPAIASIDVGGDSPWGIPVGRQDPLTGDIFITNEFYKSTVSVDEVVKWIKDKEQSGIPYPSLFPNTRYICDPENKPVVLELIKRGIMCEAARKGPKLPGILGVASYLQPKKGRPRVIPGQIRKGIKQDVIIENAPHLWFFKTCENAIREHAEWQWKRDDRTNEPTNRPVDKFDHTCDAIIYMLKVLPKVHSLPTIPVELQRLKGIHYESYRAAREIRRMKYNEGKVTARTGEMFDDDFDDVDPHGGEDKEKPW